MNTEPSPFIPTTATWPPATITPRHLFVAALLVQQEVLGFGPLDQARLVREAFAVADYALAHDAASPPEQPIDPVRGTAMATFESLRDLGKRSYDVDPYEEDDDVPF